MGRLRDIFDECDHASDKWEPYLDVYERHLSQFIGQEITIVEIGVQNGGSLEMWSKFFGPQAKIIGVDVDPNCSNLKYDQDNIEVVIGNQGEQSFWDEFCQKYPKIDIVIEDGGHSMVQQIVTINSLFPNMPTPSVYICEDCHTSYMSFYSDCDESFIDYSKGFVDALHLDWFEKPISNFSLVEKVKIAASENLTSIHYYDSIVVFEKFGKKEMNRVTPKNIALPQNSKECLPIKKCIACGSQDLVPVLDLNTQPLANSYKKTKTELQPEYPLAVNRCMHCYHVQLTHQVNPELMFKDYAYVSGTAKTSLEYFDWLVDQIVAQYGKTPEKVLDIGCNDGSLLNAWGGTGAITYGVDPAENLHHISSKNHRVHCGFYTGKEFGDTKFDVITCLNAFAHNADQLTLLKNIKERMHEDTLLFCSISQANMILNGEFDTIYHEHLSFFNVLSAKTLCERAGLNLIDVIKHPIHGGSYIFVISRDKTAKILVQRLINDEVADGIYNNQTYIKYAEKCYDVAGKFGDTIRKYRKQGYLVIGYGAPAKGNTLMNFANEAPDFIFEDNPLKQRLYTPGMSVEIREPAWIFAPDTKICWVPLAWNFYDEIVNKIKLHRNSSNDVFVKYFPEFKID